MRRQKGGLHALPVKGGSYTFATQDYAQTTAWLVLFVAFLTNLLQWNTNNRNLILATLVLLWTSFALATFVAYNKNSSLVSSILQLPWVCLTGAAILVTIAQATSASGLGGSSQVIANVAVFLEIAALLLAAY